MKRTFALAAALLFTAGSALAFHCPKDMKEIDDALAKNPKLTATQMKEVKDLRAALAAHDSIAEFERLAPSARRHALEWIANAKRPATRATRVAETARLAKMGIVMTQWRINSRR